MSRPHPLDTLAEEMAPTARQIITAVENRDPAAIAAILEPLFTLGDAIRIKALVVDLAEMASTPADDPSEQVGDQLPYGDLSASDGEKRCTGCNRMLAYAAFHVDRSRKDGLTYRCKQCRKERKPAGAQSPAEARREDYVWLRTEQLVPMGEAARQVGVCTRTAARRYEPLVRAAVA